MEGQVVAQAHKTEKEMAFRHNTIQYIAFAFAFAWCAVLRRISTYNMHPPSPTHRTPLSATGRNGRLGLTRKRASKNPSLTLRREFPVLGSEFSDSPPAAAIT
ncbi:hypothetical protein V6N11_027370 [Hibiscus sabdariffa]|uniref:Uncharacterized protein n=1 Tax=Hibiscus sabdariffa TaxID=183260 RepID=A0ABR2PGQ5_9ROSI